MIKRLTIDGADQGQSHLTREDCRKHDDETLVEETFGKSSQLGLQGWLLEEGEMSTVVANHVSGVDDQECRKQERAALDDDENNEYRSWNTDRPELVDVAAQSDGCSNARTNGSNHPLHTDELGCIGQPLRLNRERWSTYQSLLMLFRICERNHIASRHQNPAKSPQHGSSEEREPRNAGSIIVPQAAHVKGIPETANHHGELGPQYIDDGASQTRE